jgi:hypothetical protein
MNPNQLINSITNPYERKARLYPVLLAISPIFVICISVYGMAGDLGNFLTSLATTFGGLYLLVNIGRERGKRIESKLFARWGGTPTTQLQRHRDVRIDNITKDARHAFLASKLKVSAPTVAAEKADPEAADQFYAAGTRWLLEHTRDQKRFPLIFAENVSYGYRRNAYGLKPIAVTISVLSILWILISIDGVTLHGIDVLAMTQMSHGAKLATFASLSTLAIWLLFFTEQTVKTAAFAYADTFLRACSTLQ